MPLTFSHPLAVIPLRKRGFNFTGLVLGSMAPDFIYFFRGNATGHYGHTGEGLFLFCIPVSIALYLLFHLFLKRPLYDLIPQSDQKFLARTIPHPPFTVSFWLILILSISIGVGTHNFWDSFTHGDGFFVERHALFRQTLFTLAGSPVELYKLLQYLGHITGIPLLLFWYFYRHYRELEGTQSLKQIIRPWIDRSGYLLRYCAILIALAAAITQAIPNVTSPVGTTVVWCSNLCMIHLILIAFRWHQNNQWRIEPD